MDTIEIMRPVLKSQYHASLAMLRDTIERCPDALWTSGDYLNPFWRIAYHALYYTHFYLQPNADSFRPWDITRLEFNSWMTRSARRTVRVLGSCRIVRPGRENHTQRKKCWPIGTVAIARSIALSMRSTLPTRTVASFGTRSPN